MKNHAEKCPVCNGAGQLPAALWPDPNFTVVDIYPRTCHECGGLGWVTVQDPIEIIFTAGNKPEGGDLQ